MQHNEQHLQVCKQTSLQTDQRASKCETMQSYIRHAIVRIIAGVLKKQTDRHADRHADRQTDGRTDGGTDGRTDGRTRRVFSTKAYPTLFLASSVSAQPSTAMSCVAAMSTSKKKSAVIDATSALSTLHLTSNIVSPSKKKSAMVDTTSALSTCKKRATQSRKCQQCLEWLQHA